jgi:hypothetical protein
MAGLAIMLAAMIDPIEFFYVLAQIAGVFVGFGALIAVSGQQTMDELEKSSLIACVMIGLFVIIGALFPILLMSYGVSESNLWVIAAGVILVVDWITIWPQREGFLSPIRDRRYGDAAFMYGLEFLVELPLILILLPVLQDHSVALYSTSLIVSLFQGAFFMMWLVLDLRRTPG